MMCCISESLFLYYMREKSQFILTLNCLPLGTIFFGNIGIYQNDQSSISGLIRVDLVWLSPVPVLL